MLGLIGLTSTAGLTIRLWRARRREKVSNRWPFLLLVITALYGYQIATAFTAGSSLVAPDNGPTGRLAGPDHDGPNPFCSA